MTIEQIQRMLAAAFPDLNVMLRIDIESNGKACIDIAGDGFGVSGCRSIANAIESLKEKLAPVRIGHIEIDA